jgi:hypothetical protein
VPHSRVPDRCRSELLFLDKNRRHIGKSQSKRPGRLKMYARPTHPSQLTTDRIAQCRSLTNTQKKAFNDGCPRTTSASHPSKHARCSRRSTLLCTTALCCAVH